MATPYFDLSGRVAAITGGAGLLGVHHAIALSKFGAEVVVLDLDLEHVDSALTEVTRETGRRPKFIATDVTDESSVTGARKLIQDSYGRLDILINNAAKNPSVSADGLDVKSRLEHFPLSVWNHDLSVSLTGAFLCARTFGGLLSRSPHGGVILNISSDLGLIGPNQNLYRVSDLADDLQPVKPVSYSVAKAGLIGLTRYLATYWDGGRVRVNALCPGGVKTNQPSDFLERFAELVPLRRMANVDEYEGAVIFMVSDASSYMNGAVVSLDGGRTAW